MLYLLQCDIFRLLGRRWPKSATMILKVFIMISKSITLSVAWNKLVECGTSTYGISCFTTCYNMIQFCPIPSPLKHITSFVIIVVYIDDLNLVGTSNICNCTMSLLTTQFEMKFLNKTIFCPYLQVVHLQYGSIFLHQTIYIQNLLKRFHMDQANLLFVPMVGWSRSFDNPYCPCKEEEFYGKKKNFVGVEDLLYLSTYTHPNFLLHQYACQAQQNIQSASLEWSQTFVPLFERGIRFGHALHQDYNSRDNWICWCRFKFRWEFWEIKPNTLLSRTTHQSHGNLWSKLSQPSLQTTWSLFFSQSYQGGNVVTHHA